MSKNQKRIFSAALSAAVALALPLALPARSALAQGDSCQTALTLAATRLAQCRYGAEAAFAKNDNVGRRDAAFAACADQFHASFERARETWGSTCPETEPASTFSDYVAQTANATVGAAAGGPLSAFPNVCAMAGGTSLVIQNNCTVEKSLTVSTALNGQATPSCLQNLMANGGTATAYLPANSNYAFWTGSYGSSTLFEINVAPGGAATDNFDISFNQGFDIGMTIVAAPGGLVPYIVATDSTAPGAYQLPANQPMCADAPCLSPNYNSPTGGQWNLYLCNRPSDVNTPGPCGCGVCPCSTGSGGPGCNWQTVTCKGLPIPGHDGCPVTCPGT
jgi:hypothetical protein